MSVRASLARLVVMLESTIPNTIRWPEFGQVDGTSARRAARRADIAAIVDTNSS